MDIKEIQSLIKFVAKSGASEVKLEMEDIKITIRTGAVGPEPATYVQQIPMAHNPMVPAAPAPAQEGTPSVEIAAKAEVNDDDKYIIESEVSGKIVKVLVDDSSPVEFDQPLFLVDPS